MHDAKDPKRRTEKRKKETYAMIRPHRLPFTKSDSTSGSHLLNRGTRHGTAKRGQQDRSRKKQREEDNKRYVRTTTTDDNIREEQNERIQTR